MYVPLPGKPAQFSIKFLLFCIFDFSIICSEWIWRSFAFTFYIIQWTIRRKNREKYQFTAQAPVYSTSLRDIKSFNAITIPLVIFSMWVGLKTLLLWFLCIFLSFFFNRFASLFVLRIKINSKTRLHRIHFTKCIYIFTSLRLPSFRLSWASARPKYKVIENSFPRNI